MRSGLTPGGRLEQLGALRLDVGPLQGEPRGLGEPGRSRGKDSLPALAGLVHQGFLGSSMPFVVRGHSRGSTSSAACHGCCATTASRVPCSIGRGDVIRFDFKFLELAGHYRFVARPAAIAA
jgi:hypothetical protein